MREPRTTRTLRSWWGWSLAAVVAAVVATYSPQASSPTDPTLVPGLWLAAGDQVMEQSPEGAVRRSWEAPEAVQALAVDRRRGTVWLLGARTLSAHGSDGGERFAVESLSGAEVGFLAVRPQDGSVWAGRGSQLVNVGAGGEVLGKAELAAGLVGLTLDARKDLLWAATGRGLEARDAVSGALLEHRELPAGEARFLTLDSLGRPWVGTERRLFRGDQDGELALYSRSGLTAAAEDASGTMWGTNGKRLMRFGDMALQQLPDLGRPAIDGLVADPSRSGMWVLSGGQAFWVDDRGRVQEAVGVPSGALSAFAVVPGPRLLEAHARPLDFWLPSVDPPQIAVNAVPSFLLVNETEAEVRVTFTETDRPLDLASLAITLDGTDITASCAVDAAAGEAVCSLGPLAGGPHTAAAEIADAEGNRATAEAAFHVLLGAGRHEVALPATTDTFLRALLPNFNEGDKDFLQVRWVGLDRSLVRFQLAEVAPQIDQLVSAHLELTIQANADNWGLAGRPVSVHRLEEGWTEEGATWHCGHDGNTSNPWRDCEDPWNGGSYVATPSAAVLHTNGLEGRVSWEVTADVAAMLSGSVDDHGWLVRRQEELWPGWIRYASREAGLAVAPKLVLVFDGGEPLDTTPPQLAITSPAAGAVVTTASPEIVFAYSDDLSGVDPESLAVTLDGAPLALSCTFEATTATCSPDAPLAEGLAIVAATVADFEGNVSAPATVTFTVETTPPGPDLPPDPATVAPPLDRTVATDLFTSTEFLYTGPDPIQTGVAPGTIKRRRAAVLRGRVLDRNGQPLPGVTVTVLGHPEYGSTLSRADGVFDLVVNGGGLLTVTYEKDGYLPSQRQEEIPWRDYRWFEDVVLIPYDAATTEITSGATEVQVARGTPQTDADGTRQATLLFPAGTTAEMELEDGSTQPLSVLTLRATEYTVGETGPEAMPGPLPSTVAYTYAVELSADEAEAAGAIEVRFNQAAYLYVENFLGFPVGDPVPLGSWDRRQAAWIGSPNGRVIEILGTDPAGLAEIDTDGSGTPADASTLAELGFTDAERARVAQLYSAGTQLWRSPIPHLTPWDCNWPWAPAADAQAPPPDTLDNPAFEHEPEDPEEISDPQDPESDRPHQDEPCERNGSVLEVENQSLRETVDLPGTPYQLVYQSDRQPGHLASFHYRIRLTRDEIPDSLKRVDLAITVAGRSIRQSFPPQAGQFFSFDWDGKDAYGRQTQGRVSMSVEKSYAYDLVYAEPEDFETSWARFPRGPGRTPRRGIDTEVTSTVRTQGSALDFAGTVIGTWDALEQGFGGWTLDAHHVYEPESRTLHLGSGGRRTAARLGPVIRRVAGLGQAGYSGDGGPARAARLRTPSDVDVLADGTLIVTDTGNQVLRAVSPQGIVTTIAGTGEICYEENDGPGDNDLQASPGLGIPGGEPPPDPGCGDGGPATSARLSSPQAVAAAPDGSLFIADTDANCIRRIDAGGTIETYAGTCTDEPGVSTFSFPVDLALGPGNILYVADRGNGRIAAVYPGGGIGTVAAGLSAPAGVAAAETGTVYVADGSQVLQIDTAGQMSVFAGTGEGGSSGDGGPATEARLASPQRLLALPDGSVVVSDAEANTLRRIDGQGIIFTVAGTGFEAPALDGALAAGTHLRRPLGMSLAPDGSLLLADAFQHSALRMALALEGFSDGDYVVPAESGVEVYVFDSQGRHQRTVHPLTGEDLLSFSYDEAGLVTGITDRNGQTTTVERDPEGRPTRIEGPTGQATRMVLDPDGFLKSVIDEAGGATNLTYQGLLLSLLEDREGRQTQWTYDDLGRLREERNAAGGTQSFQHHGRPGSPGSTVRWSSGGGQAVAYKSYRDPDGSSEVTVNDGSLRFNRGQTERSGRRTYQSARGSFSTWTPRPDPRFGALVPRTQTETFTTGGKTRQLTGATEVTLSDPDDPFAIEELTETVTVNGRTFTSRYDGTERRFTFTSEEGRESTLTIDAKGRILEQAVAGLAPVRYSYDGTGLLTSVAQGEGSAERTTTFTYDEHRRLERMEDSTGEGVNLQYDLINRQTRQVYPDGSEIGFTYDAAGNMTALVPPGRPASATTYSPLDLPEAFMAPGAGEALRVVYDLDRRLTEVHRPGGEVVGFHYDGLDRLERLSSARGDFLLTYDPVDGYVSRIETPEGEVLVRQQDGELFRQATWQGTVAGSVSFDHDDSFRLISQSVNGGSTVAYAYDGDSLLTQAGALSLSRDPANGLLRQTSLGTVTTIYIPNAFGELEAVEATAGTQSLYRLTVSRDARGRITSKTETVLGEIHTYAYGYDARGRLLSVERDGVNVEAYTYGPNNNRLSATDPGGTATATYDTQDRILTSGDLTYEHTAAGELLRKSQGGASVTYQYDAFGNLLAVTPSSGPATSYVIDGQSRRIGKKVDGQLTKAWLWGGALAPVAELDGAGNLVSRFVYATHGNVPDYMLREGVTYRFVKDHLGSVRLVVNTTTGEVAQRLDYGAFGQVQLDTNPGFQPFGYAGGLYDPATGLVRFGVRDYDPQAGRWATPDPIGYASGDTNLYAYAYNSPTNLRDPSGAVVPLIVGGVIVYNLFEAGMTVADLVDVYDTFTDPWADFWDKGLSAAGAAAGIWLPGGGYGRGAKGARELAEAASREIASGHAFRKHVIQRREFPGIETEEQFAQVIETVLTRPTHVRELARGRRAFFDDASGVLVITDPGSVDGGTAFIPTNGLDYVLGLQ